MFHILESRQREEKDMRRFINSLVVAALGVAAAIMPTTASAQTLDRILGVVSAGTAFGWNSCSYVQGGLQSAACQANRAVNAVNTLRQSQLNNDWRRSQRYQQRAQQLDAMQRACRAGDQESCARSGGTDPRTMEIARALNDACHAGDRRSCRRADKIMDERNTSIAYRDDRGYAQDRPAFRRDEYASRGQECRPAIDPRTGYRIAGQLVCR
jgi:hypothetical protein